MNRNFSIFVIFLFSASVSSLHAEGYPTDDPSLRSYQETTSQYINRCKGDLSHVEKSNCYHDQIKAIQVRVSAEYKKRLIEAEATKADAAVGDKTGEERAKILVRTLKRVHTAWQLYIKEECNRIFEEFTIGGGNGGDLEHASCMIRHLVARYNELR